MAIGTDAARSRLPQKLVRGALLRPGPTIVLWLAACLASVPGLLALDVDTSTDSVLDREDPAWAVYQRSVDLFGSDEMIAVALQAPAPYDAALLERIPALAEALARLDGVARVDSIATVPVIRSDAAGDLILSPALEDAPDSPEARSRHVASVLAEDRIAPRNFVSSNGRVFALNLVLDHDAAPKHARLLHEIHALVDPIGGLVSGVPVFRVAANERTGSEILLFAPLTAAIIVLLVASLFRSLWAVVLTTAPGVVGAWLMLATMGALGVRLSITTMVLPSVILALGCAYSMHVLTAASTTQARDDRLESAIAVVTFPVALSGLTTCIGFLSIAVVRIDAVRLTGAYGALGVLIVTLASLTLVPAALRLRAMPATPPLGFAWLRGAGAETVANVALRRRRGILLTWVGLAILMGLGLGWVEVETDATRWLPPGNPVRDDYEEIRSALSGISPVNVVVDAPEGGSILQPEALEALDRLTRHLEALPTVGRALSIADPLRQMSGAFAGRPGQPLPRSRGEAEQFLLLLSSVDAIDSLITPNRRSASVALRVDDNGSAQLMAIADEALRYWAQEGVRGYEASATGIMYEFARAEDEIAYGQLRGLSLALLMISALMLAIFGWPKLALTAALPNALPLLLIFGAMGWLGVPLDAGTVMLGGLALGIAVDDTIHLATGYQARVERGVPPEVALRSTLSQVLPALVATTGLIACSFAVLALSEFTIISHLGSLTAGIMILCLAADLSLLVTLLPTIDVERHTPR